jgi:hypothetical protein
MDIGGRFLATGDVDYYVYVRAILPSWRADMDDPKDRPIDPRFHLLPSGCPTLMFG